MSRKEAVKVAVKATVHLGLEYLKRVGLVTGVSGIALIGLALAKPNFYKDIK